MGKKMVVSLLVLAAACAAGIGYFWPLMNGQGSLRFFGIVEIQEVRLGSKVGGRVEQIYVEEGDTVGGQKDLLKLEQPELEAQLAQLEAKKKGAEAAWEKAKNGPRVEELDSARAAVRAAKARLERLEKGWREEEIRQAFSEFQAADTLHKDALADFDRIANLFKKQAASRTEFDDVIAGRDRSLALKNAAQARYDMLKSGNRVEDIEEAKALWEQARAKYQELEAGTRKEDVAAAEAQVLELQAKIQELKVHLKESVVRAPDYPVIIEVISVRKGDLVPPNQPVIRVLNARDLWVKFFVPETELDKVKVGDTVQVTIDAPDKTFKGQVRHINPISEFLPRNVQSKDERRHQVFAAKVQVEDPQGVMKAGMAAEVMLLNTPRR